MIPQPGFSPPARALPLAEIALLGLVFLPFIAGCMGEQLLSGQQPPVSCSQRRLEYSAALFGEARTQMARHFKERSAMTLHYAYYLSNDAIQFARSARGCPDFNDAVRSQALNLIRTSRQLRILAVTNMRDPDPLVTMTLMQDRYADLFVNRDVE
jgi:hypothetical protein